MPLKISAKNRKKEKKQHNLVQLKLEKFTPVHLEKEAKKPSYEN